IKTETKLYINSNNPFKWFWFSLKRSTDFKTRSCRKELWMFLIMSNFFAFLFIIIFVGTYFALIGENQIGREEILGVIGVGGFIYDLLTLIPVSALITRRFHDVGASGWLTLIVYIASFSYLILEKISKETLLVYLVILLAIFNFGLTLILLFAKGDKGDNAYGHNPIEWGN
ncbi:DUF805 domain-containing protein, partial [Desulfurella sp.]|uniref:DUF805 domain-containing protein n=1 Tax=Desulfurella sp. TaxID=1962857 RepID=UPI00257DF6B0